MGLTMDDIQLKATCFEVGGDAKVMKVTKPPGHAFRNLERKSKRGQSLKVDILLDPLKEGTMRGHAVIIKNVNIK